MEKLYKHLLHIALTVPLLLYLGITIVLNMTEPVYFNYLVLLALVLVVISHMFNFGYLYKKVKNGYKFEETFGIILIILALLILIINIIEIVYKK